MFFYLRPEGRGCNSGWSGQEEFDVILFSFFRALHRQSNDRSTFLLPYNLSARLDNFTQLVFLGDLGISKPAGQAVG